MKRNYDDYDINGIKNEVDDYYGTAMMSGLPMAQADLVAFDVALENEEETDDVIMREAEKTDIDLSKHYTGKRR